MKETTPQFPTEEVTLPSKGLLYPEDSTLRKGTIEMKYMTAKEEDILTNQNYIEDGTVIDKLLQSLIVSPIDYDELLVGDKNAILIASRILGYGKDYTFEWEGEIKTIDLTTIEDKNIGENLLVEGINEFPFTLSAAKKEITFKFLTHKDEKKISNELKGLKKLNKKSDPSITTRMKYLITSIGGDYEAKTIRNFVDNNLLAIDARELRKYIKNNQPDVDLSFEHEDDKGNFKKVMIPLGISFFWPDVEL
tara:strand:+ start:259 stop:1008 length:750 start_codon:yes stop_codon:yes gene_type:complete